MPFLLFHREFTGRVPSRISRLARTQCFRCAGPIVFTSSSLQARGRVPGLADTKLVFVRSLTQRCRLTRSPAEPSNSAPVLRKHGVRACFEEPETCQELLRRSSEFKPCISRRGFTDGAFGFTRMIEKHVPQGRGRKTRRPESELML